MKKLELKNLKVKAITREEKTTIKGGEEQQLVFLSIGFKCSLENNCTRLETARTNCTVLSFACA